MVRVNGIQVQPDLNGQIGCVHEWYRAQGRWAVRLADGLVKLFKESNLTVIADSDGEWLRSHRIEVQKTIVSRSDNDKSFKMWLLEVAPNGALDGYAQILRENYESVDQLKQLYLKRIGSQTTVDGRFFVDVQVHDKAHQALYSLWFARDAYASEDLPPDGRFALTATLSFAKAQLESYPSLYSTLEHSLIEKFGHGILA